MTIKNISNGVFLNSSDGTDIFASAAGNPSNPAIVFVHGYTYSAVVFDDILKDERLLDKYYMISYDLRGHGRSGKPNTPEAYTSKMFADDFVAVIKHFKVKSVLYAGWSYGGTVATDIFAHLPSNTISGIFAIAAIPTVHLVVNKPLTGTLAPQFGVTDDVSANITARAAFLDACFNDPSKVPVQTKWAWLGSSVLQTPDVSVLHALRTQDTTKFFEAGARGLPYLALIGTADKLLSNDKITESLKPHFTNLEVHEVEGGSHALFVDNKEEFVKVLVGFADKVFGKQR